MLKAHFRRSLVAVMVLVSLLLQGTWALAGTTGNVSGTVTDAATNAPISNAKVSVTSPSQATSATTDSSGHFTILSLAPDSYTVSVDKQGYDPISIAGVNVFADQTQSLALHVSKTIREIGRVTSRSASDLVKPGTTADIYSVDAARAAKITALGGGGGLDNAYSAIASVPGAFVPQNQMGWYQTVYVRGGDFDQVGYEYDGVPVNRSFDNYPSTTASALGQQELQLYTGAAPANAESQGLAGFINQVIKSGTYPGFLSSDVAIGGPTFYHKLNVEIGGATPNRNFSYYVGLGGYNTSPRVIDNSNGSSYTNRYGIIFDEAPCPTAAGAPTQNYVACYAGAGNALGIPIGPGGYLLGGPQMYTFANLSDRESVVNLHFGIPHHNDGGKDDIQVLYSSSALFSQLYSSVNDWGTALYQADALNPASQSLPANVGSVYPVNISAFNYTGPVGGFLGANYKSQIQLYNYPNDQGLAPNQILPFDKRDGSTNTQSIFKLQYQKNLGSSAYLRVYGYTFYSDWLLSGANCANQGFTFACSAAPDYELSSHTRGLSGQFADQINSKNLITLQGSVTTATSVRDNNTEMYQSLSGSRNRFAVLVDPNNPTNGVCYRLATSGTAALPTTCDTGAAGGVRATWATLTGAAAGGVNVAAANAQTCGTGACQYYVAENGTYATYNTVKPVFTAGSITDQWKPTDRLLINLGLRFDQYQFKGADTSNNAYPARTFWFNASNASYCSANNGTLAFNKVSAAGTTTAYNQPCPAGTTPFILNDASSPVNTYSVVQPRLGATYTVNPDNVLRASYGSYGQPPNAAYEQYNTAQQNLPNFLIPQFSALGFTTPGHAIRPAVSYNSDFSWEHHFRGTDISFKASPFYRHTHDQLQNFFLNQQTGFVSGLNVGSLTATGLEFQLTKGDFNRNGFAGLLSYTYTHSTIKYGLLPTGLSPLQPINNDIKNYNAYTSACANGSANKALCGATSSGVTAAACFTSTGTPDPTCAAGSIANPYWNDNPHGLLDPNAAYAPYSTLPDGVGSSASSFEVPNSLTLVLNYKRDKWTFTPSLQWHDGPLYGAPESVNGIDPAAGCAAYTGPNPGSDPYGARYPHGLPTGATNANQYDAMTCGAALNAIPDPYTGQFDNLGSFKQPSQISMHMQIGYEMTNKVGFTLTLANILSRCYGGSSAAWTAGSDRTTCSYGVSGQGLVSPAGNFYNPNSTIQGVQLYPYQANPGEQISSGLNQSTIQPFSMYFQMHIKV